MTAIKVLVTRPVAQAKAMVELMQKQGFQVQHLPCLAIESVQLISEDGLQSKRLSLIHI